MVTVYLSESIPQTLYGGIVAVIKQAIKRDSGIEPSVTISSVVASSGISLVMTDFGNLSALKAKNIIESMGIEVANFAQLKRRELHITMHATLTCDI